MRVNRDIFLRCLESVGPGLAVREIIEQSSCFVFQDGQVATFNDEVACIRESPLKELVGAVRAAPLLSLLSKLPDDDIDVSVGDSELIIKGTNKRAGIVMEKNVLLPISSVETPAEWRTIEPEFSEVIAIVKECTGKDEEKFRLSCVHITDDFIEACDDFQICRHPFKLGIGDVLVRGEAVKHLVGLDMTEIGVTDSWLHFRNPAGLRLSIRRFREDYPDLSGYLGTEGHRASLPGGLAEAVEKAEVFSSDNANSSSILVDLKPGRLMIEGRGASGWYQERREISYKGEELKFMIAPKLLLDIAKRTTDCIIAPGRLIIDSGKFIFVGCLAQTEELASAVS